MDNAVMIWTYNQLIAGIVVETVDKVIDMMRFRNMGTELFTD